MVKEDFKATGFEFGLTVEGLPVTFRDTFSESQLRHEFLPIVGGRLTETPLIRTNSFLITAESGFIPLSTLGPSPTYGFRLDDIWGSPVELPYNDQLVRMPLTRNEVGLSFEEFGALLNPNDNRISWKRLGRVPNIEEALVFSKVAVGG